MNFVDNIKRLFGTQTTEKGSRSTDAARLRAMYQQQQPNFDLASKITQIRVMDQVDGHVKRIHHRTSHALTKGGLTLVNPSKNTRLASHWRDYQQRLALNNRNKLASDARGLLMEGNLYLQLVLDSQQSYVMSAIRMPAETMRTITNRAGQIANFSKAFAQFDQLSGQDQATFAFWQMAVARLDPLNFDDLGEPGRPFLDASRKVWQQMQMTLEDLVIRRRQRAPMRTAHILEGADEDALAAYKKQVENEQESITTNFYLNKKGGVQSIPGDSNLDQVKDISLLLDAFFSGTPAPKGLFGYADGLSRDILMDLQAQFFDELDVSQDLQAWVYQEGFKIDLLLHGFNPDSCDWEIKFSERMTDTPNQRADLALKYQAIGASKHTIWKVAGLDPHQEEQLLQQEQDSNDPYPLIRPTASPSVKITPGNAPKGESSTSITNGGA